MTLRALLAFALLSIWSCKSAGASDTLFDAAALAVEEAAIENGDDNAFASLHLRAAQGDALAQTQLGSYYDQRQGMKHDYTRGMKWYLLAAHQGFAPAQSNLAAHYEQGQGIPKNPTEAFNWAKQAAEQGDYSGQLALAFDYWRGSGVAINYVRANFWLSVAALTNPRAAGLDVIPSYVSPEQRSAIAKSATSWKPRTTPVTASVERMEKELQEITGHGDTTPMDSDIPKIIESLKDSAGRGEPYAQDILGDLYYRGELGIAQNYGEAAKWWHRSAEQGNSAAQKSLGGVYSTARGVKQDWAEAAKWLHKAADQGNFYAYAPLGDLYAKGQGVARDAAEARRWYRKASDQGIFSAQYQLGLIYESGRGVKQDYAEAYFWLSLASTSGDKEMIALRGDIEKHLTSEQVAAVKKRAEQWNPVSLRVMGPVERVTPKEQGIKTRVDL